MIRCFWLPQRLTRTCCSDLPDDDEDLDDALTGTLTVATADGVATFSAGAVGLRIVGEVQGVVRGTRAVLTVHWTCVGVVRAWQPGCGYVCSREQRFWTYHGLAL